MRSVCYSLFALAIAGFAARGADAMVEMEEAPATECSPVLQETVGSSGYPYIDNAVEIVSQGETSVTFNVNQVWLQDGTPMLAVSYRDSEQAEDICALEATPEGDIIPYDATHTYTAECHHGFAEIAVYLYVGTSTSFIFEECESCSAPNDNYCGYYITVPCVACETESPTTSPTKPIDPSPPAPPDCAEASKAVLTTTGGDADAFPEFENPITIISQDVDEVTITVGQVFDETVPMLQVGYPNPLTGIETCDMSTGNLPSFFETTVTAQCTAGYAEVSIYLYTGDATFNVEDCEMCTLVDEDNYVAYLYVIPCVPVCKPEIPDCLNGPLVTLADIGTENDICVYGEMPVIVQDDNMNSESVGFYIDNTWTSTGLPGDEITAVSVSYTSAKTGDVTCDSFDGGIKFITSDDLTAVCDDGMATIVVSAYSSGISYVADQIESNTCSPPEDLGACSYEVVLPCDPQVVCGSTDSPTKSPTVGPTKGPTPSPTSAPTPGPTKSPTPSPTSSPTPGPTKSPTAGPTKSPTPSPTSGPTPSPTAGPTKSPTPSPTSGPTPSPTEAPTGDPTTAVPTGAPTFGPTNFPTQEPSASAPPSGCHEPSPPNVVGEVCMTAGGDMMDAPLALPDGAITITSTSEDGLTFDVSQEWIDGLAGLAIRPGIDGECTVEGAVENGVTFGTYQTDCMHGFASVTIVAYLDKDFNPEKCEACSVEDLSDMGGDEEFCAYNIEIPCESVPVDCKEPSASPSGSFFPSSDPTPSPSKSQVPTPGPTGTPTKGPTPSPTAGPTPSPTGGPTPSPTAGPTPSPTAGPTPSPTGGPTPSPTGGPTPSPTVSPTPSPTSSPTKGPTASPTDGPTPSPTGGPTPSPTVSPTSSPTPSPTSSPTGGPTPGPTAGPTPGPTPGPTTGPTSTPTKSPTPGPTKSPTTGPTPGPTESPTFGPTNFPTQEPSASAPPTGCYEPSPPNVVGDVCMTAGGDMMDAPLALPDGAITITSTSDEGITFEVSQEWIDGLAGLAIRPGMDECTVESAVDNGVTFGTYQSECLHGFASVTIVAYLDKDFNPEKCDACSVEELSEMGGDEEFCAYQVEIPCESIPVECGEPSASPSGSFFPSSDPTPSPSKSQEPTPGPTGTPTKGPTPSPTDGPTPGPTPGPTSSPTKSPTSGPTPGPTAGPTSSPTKSPTAGPTPGPTDGPTPGPTPGPTDAPTPGPTPGPTSSPTKSPTAGPTAGPTQSPTPGPTPGPTKSPTPGPTPGPTTGPTTSPTPGPTAGPTKSPTPGPTPGPTVGPTDSPTPRPSESPSGSFYPSTPPSDSPTRSPAPTASPTGAPTPSPTSSPTPGPTSGPTPGPTTSPTPGPTTVPTKSPTPGPTAGPTKSPTPGPTPGPTTSPTPGPTAGPTAGPTKSPTPSPTGEPTPGPSDPPTFGPTGFPTKEPSQWPTGAPTASMAPTSCTVPMPPKIIDSVCMTTGGEEMELQPLPDDAITINNLMDEQVSITISQAWADIAGIAIEAGMDSCTIKEGLTLGSTEELMATCVEGYAGVTVVVYLDATFDPDKCDACNVDDLSEMGGNSEFCAYRMEIPCDTMEVECGEPSAQPSGSFYPSSVPTPSPSKSQEPTPAPTGTPTSSPTPSPTTSPTPSPTSSPTSSPTPSPTSSPTPSPTEKTPTDPPSGAPTQCPPSDAILIATEGETSYPDLPITITYQNTTHVEFYVENTFTQTVSSVYTQYHSGSFGETECLSADNVDDVVPIEFVAQCMRHTKISIVNIWITDCEITNTILGGPDNAEIPECCYPGEVCKTVQYTFKLPCESPCPVDGLEQVGEEAPPARRLVSDLIKAKKAEEGTRSEFEELVGHPEPNDSTDHFCVIEDYPCGAFHDKVHVCHYSARDGYKTFCVPESDSDALRFYPKDYCGPCVGGYHAQA